MIHIHCRSVACSPITSLQYTFYFRSDTLGFSSPLKKIWAKWVEKKVALLIIALLLGFPKARWQMSTEHYAELFCLSLLSECGESYLLTGWCGLRGLPSWRGMSSTAEHHRHAGRCNSMVGAEWILPEHCFPLQHTHTAHSTTACSTRKTCHMQTKAQWINY